MQRQRFNPRTGATYRGWIEPNGDRRFIVDEKIIQEAKQPDGSLVWTQYDPETKETISIGKLGWNDVDATPIVLQTKRPRTFWDDLGTRWSSIWH